LKEESRIGKRWEMNRRRKEKNWRWRRTRERRTRRTCDIYGMEEEEDLDIEKVRWRGKEEVEGGEGSWSEIRCRGSG
jgi:hypothetical protein